MTRQVWIGVVSAVVIVAVGIGGFAGWQAWQGRCVADFRDIPADDLPDVSLPADYVANADQPAEPALSAQAPFGEPRAAIPNPRRPQLTGAGMVVQYRPVSVIDGWSAEAVWGRTQDGYSYAAEPIGDHLVLAHVSDDELTVAVTKRVSGDLLECHRIANGADAPDLDVRTAGGAQVDERSIALIHRVPDRGLSLLRTDVYSGEVVWQRSEDREHLSDFVHRAGDVLVTTFMDDGLQAGWDTIFNLGRTVRPEWLRLSAFSVVDGAPVWDYGFEDDHGGAPFAHQVVGTTDELVVVRASRLDDGSDTIENFLLALDASTGIPAWTEVLPSVSSSYYSVAGLFDDVVVTVESDKESQHRAAWLAGYDVNSGDELWRVENQTTDLLEGSAVIDGALAVPGLSRHGLELIDLHTGNSETHFDGLSVLEVTTDDLTAGVTFLIDSDPVFMVYALR
ncbi:PQQ-binding-like beta-propeller repeat protein [Phytoactinopolyspora limicola]|uniref:outer membrane protein assembly factor BamB family protein n=1 Tax=Phytoactinopolyspora limicola TaxID=2715536 RepID=UPI00140AF7B5|nr:PQQ-binding-like beta-propeller repeat protein [Phytoactinopolyspora limicola]